MKDYPKIKHIEVFKHYVCPICGKEFVIEAVQSGYAYVHNGKKYCSWKCYRKAFFKNPPTTYDDEGYPIARSDV